MERALELWVMPFCGWTDVFITEMMLNVATGESKHN